jgi:hypothetical protein
MKNNVKKVGRPAEIFLKKIMMKSGIEPHALSNQNLILAP